jgi:hypothetical protein
MSEQVPVENKEDVKPTEAQLDYQEAEVNES